LPAQGRLIVLVGWFAYYPVLLKQRSLKWSNLRGGIILSENAHDGIFGTIRPFYEFECDPGGFFG
jgi:hypothetical protein